jgi:Xaa-Pro dipeptidase
VPEGAVPSLPPILHDYASRQDRLRAELERVRASGLLLTPGPNLRYFSGVAIAQSERLLLLVLRLAGGPLLIAPHFERDRVRQELGRGGLLQNMESTVELVTWAESQDPLALVAGILAGGSWLLDPVTPFGTAARLVESGLELRSGEQVCIMLRRKKDAGEIELIRRAQEATRSTLAAVRESLSPGVTESDVVREIQSAFVRRGTEGWALVQFGPTSALPHGEPAGRALTEDCAVLVDLGAIIEGYHADLTRSWWFGGRPPSRYAEVASAVKEAQSRAAGLARAGTAAQELDRTARHHLEARGLGQHFVHRLGHGVGLEIHEPPFLVEGNESPLEPGDVFTIEPGVYLAGEFGVRHEDLWVVGEDGGMRL